MKDYKNQVEAILFASGRYMDIDTLLSLTGASSKQVLINNITRLKQEYEERSSPLLLTEEKNGWKLTVREAYLPLVRNIVSETELQKSVLETLAVIAWKSPVLQSDVVAIRHNKAYDHIAELLELGFVKKDPSGRSYVISLTDKFYEYFDVEGATDIREVFEKVAKKGLPSMTIPTAREISPQSEENEQADSLLETGKEFSELDEMGLAQEAETEEYSELDQLNDTESGENEVSELDELGEPEEQDEDDMQSLQAEQDPDIESGLDEEVAGSSLSEDMPASGDTDDETMPLQDQTQSSEEEQKPL